jgi:hypothetical protein
MHNADGLLLQGGEWDSPLLSASKCAKDDVKVCGGGEQSVGAGAEPLSNHRLLLAGHHD